MIAKKDEEYWLGQEFVFNILNQLPTRIFWKNSDGVFLGCNRAFLEAWNLSSPQDVIGKTDYDLPTTKEESDSYRADDNEVMRSRKAKLNIEESQTHADGTEVILLTSKVPLFNKEGEVIGILGVYNDITELKKTQQELLLAKEAAEAASQAKTEFVQNMQHDIRTPAAGIWGLLDILTSKAQDPEHRKILKMATESSKKLLDLCNEAVEFGDLQGNAKPIIEEKIDPREMAKSVVELNLPAVFGKNLSLNFKVAANVPPHIISDSYRLNRMVINLLGNAIKFTDKGEVSLSLSAKNKGSDRHGILIIEVKDTGIGISKNKISTVFQKFSRGVASNTNKYPGTGLGLYVVKTFVDDLDADIEFESYEGEGSRFKIALPVKIPHDNEGQAATEINETYHSPLNIAAFGVNSRQSDKKNDVATSFNHKVLIIEDDPLCLFAEKEMASVFTSHIDTATTMDKALALLDAHRYDVVIADLGLPDGSGEEIVATVRALAASPNRKTPFIAMTAHRDKEKHQEAVHAGFNEIATKPLTEQKLEQFLRTYPIIVDKSAKNEGIEDLEVIDLELTIKRLGAKTVKAAAVGLGLLADSLKEDIQVLQKGQQQNDILVVREILHKIRGGLYYSGTPCLEKAVVDLHAAVKSVEDLTKIAEKFNAVYEEVKIFEEYYQTMMDESV